VGMAAGVSWKPRTGWQRIADWLQFPLDMPVIEPAGRSSRDPGFADRSVVFFSNLLALFFGNREETRCLADEVGDLDSYGGRLIPILDLLFGGGDNVLVLECRPDPGLCAYLADSLGLQLPRLEILSHDLYSAIGTALELGDRAVAGRLERIGRSSGAEWVDGYVTDPALERIAALVGKRTLSSHRGSRGGNNKLYLHRHLVKRGLPQPETEIAESPAAVAGCTGRLARLGYRSAVVRAQIGASGIGMVKLPRIGPGAELPEIPEHLFFEGPCLVQGWLEPGVLGVTGIRSPSVQLFIGDDTADHYDLTEQILSEDSVHQGNESPPPVFGGPECDAEVKEELLRQAGVAGEWLGKVGYRGTASADFLVVEREGRPVPEVHVCEVNARVTGATYPSLLARHFLPRGAWLLRNLRLEQPESGEALLARLDHGGQLFVPSRGSGVLPVNFNVGADDLIHKGQFLCLADDVDGCRELLAATRDELPVVSKYERD
jgi:hypothetical protein